MSSIHSLEKRGNVLAEKLLSICIPTYNRMPELKKALDSIIECSNGIEEEIQICVSDNCSTDETFDYLKKFSKTSKIEIKINRYEVNKGFDANVLQVLQMGDGKYCWLFGDDEYFINPGFRQIIEKFKTETDENCFLFLSGLIVPEGVKTFSKNLTSEKEERWDFEGLILNTPAFISCMIFNKQILSEFFNSRTGIIKNGLDTQYMHVWLIRMLCIFNPKYYAKRLPISAFATIPSWSDLQGIRRQFKFMLDSMQLHSRSLLISIKEKNARRYIIKFAKKLFVHYLQILSNFTMARKFRDTSFEFDFFIYLVKRYHILSPWLAIPYAIIMFLPKILVNLAYKIETKLALKLRITNKDDLMATEYKWSKKLNKMEMPND